MILFVKSIMQSTSRLLASNLLNPLIASRYATRTELGEALDSISNNVEMPTVMLQDRETHL